MSILDAQHDRSAFRPAIRDWLAKVVPPDWKARMARASNEEYIHFQRWWMAERSKVGLAIPHWPKEYGGAGLSQTTWSPSPMRWRARMRRKTGCSPSRRSICRARCYRTAPRPKNPAYLQAWPAARV